MRITQELTLLVCENFTIYLFLFKFTVSRTENMKSPVHSGLFLFHSSMTSIKMFLSLYSTKTKMSIDSIKCGQD